MYIEAQRCHEVFVWADASRNRHVLDSINVNQTQFRVPNNREFCEPFDLPQLTAVVYSQHITSVGVSESITVITVLTESDVVACYTGNYFNNSIARQMIV